MAIRVTTIAGAGASRERVRAFALWWLLAIVPLPGHAAQWFVETNGVAFSPQFITIDAGDTVTWLNRGGNHNVVADDGSFRCAHGCDGDGHGGSGNPSSSLWIVSVTFNQPGTVGYFCEPHGSPGDGMYGTITVLAPPVLPVPSGNGLLWLALAGSLLAVGGAWLRRGAARRRAAARRSSDDQRVR